MLKYSGIYDYFWSKLEKQMFPFKAEDDERQVEVCIQGRQGETSLFPIIKPHALDVWTEQSVQRPTNFFILCLKENPI